MECGTNITKKDKVKPSHNNDRDNDYKHREALTKLTVITWNYECHNIIIWSVHTVLVLIFNLNYSVEKYISLQSSI